MKQMSLPVTASFRQVTIKHSWGWSPTSKYSHTKLAQGYWQHVFKDCTVWSHMNSIINLDGVYYHKVCHAECIENFIISWSYILVRKCYLVNLQLPTHFYQHSKTYTSNLNHFGFNWINYKHLSSYCCHYY